MKKALLQLEHKKVKGYRSSPIPVQVQSLPLPDYTLLNLQVKQLEIVQSMQVSGH